MMYLRVFHVDTRVVSYCSPDFVSVAFESSFGSCICVVNYDIVFFLLDETGYYDFSEFMFLIIYYAQVYQCLVSKYAQILFL